MFDQLAHVKKDHIVGNAPRLAKNVSDDYNRIILFQKFKLLFNQLGGDRVES